MLSPISTPGITVKETERSHAVRADLRRLVARLFDAVDAGDLESVVAAFSPDATLLWGTKEAVGREAIAESFSTIAATEPWSIHLLSNEHVVALDESAHGTWLWQAVSLCVGGVTSAWSGGDLAVDTARVDGLPDALVITRLVRSDRYRVPVATGWLGELHHDLNATSPDHDAEFPLPRPISAASLPDPSRSVEAMCAEVDVQALAAALVRATEEHGVGDTDAVPIRFLGSPRISVSHGARRATGIWRELVTAGGASPRWELAEVELDACVHGGRWDIESVTRRILVDGRYGATWREATSSVSELAGPYPAAPDVTVEVSGPSLELLDASVAIRSVHTAYMAACDEHDPDQVAPLFVADGHWETMDGSEVLDGVEEIHAVYTRDCNRLSFCVHYLGNERIELTGSDTARAYYSYFEPATNRGELAVWTAGRYELELVCNDGRWRYRDFRIEGRLAAPYATGWSPTPMIPLP